MLSYRVLVVDNDDDLLIAAEEQLSEIEGVQSVCARSVEEAAELIRSDFFHLAVVDLKLHNNFDSGMEVLQMLSETSPSCERYAMTRLAREDPHGLLRVVSAYNPLVGGIINKQARTHRSNEFGALAGPKAREFRSKTVDFDGLAAVIDAVLASKRLNPAGNRSNAALEAELRTILQKLFGGRVPQAPGHGALLEVALVNQGLSGAVAFSVVPLISTAPPQRGSYCFVKVGQRDAIEQEGNRFRDRVQMNVPLKFRVDLLGLELGDGLGAIAYSFAGGGVAAIRSLDGVAADEGLDSDLVISTIERLFDRSEASWYLLSGSETSIGAYFEQELRSNFIERLPILHGACRKIAANLGGQYDSDAGILALGRCRLSVPNDQMYGVGYLTRKRPTSLMHGDMHGGNVLISELDQLYLIDFAHAGFGPRAVDAAVLHGTVRLWDAPNLVAADDLPSALDSLVQREERVARHWYSGEEAESSRPGWERPALSIENGLRANFSDLPAEDVLWVYLLHAARLSTLHIRQEGRLRILAWFTGVKRALGEAKET